ncbi:hypothetical protein [Brucella anthropi]|uniref:hypothetical protein n=1 Tax=Brucella anthropi TaxID=529 RepID=UPI001E51589A|nr:hypothetical protein [Brucella anthropi]UGQ22257.1 hypothetical protein LRL11_06015 [Brucella anthropi]
MDRTALPLARVGDDGGNPVSFDADCAMRVDRTVPIHRECGRQESVERLELLQ